MDLDLQDRIEAQIERLLVRYVAWNDARRWHDLAGLFLDDGELVRPSAPQTPILGRDAILASFLARPADRRLRHLCTNVCVEVLSESSARAVSTYVIYAGRLLGDDPLPVLEAGPPVLCEFHDEVVRTAQGWRFAVRRGAMLFRVAQGR